MYQGKFDAKHRNGENTSELRESLRKHSAEAPAVEEAPRKKGPRIGGIIFYTLYFLFIAAFCFGIFYVSNWLEGWLTDYQAAQPTTKCEQAFQQLFANPDWAALYTTAGIQDTDYEGQEEFVTYMENKVGTNALGYMETSAGLSGDKKYFITMGDERIGYFTLVAHEESASGIPDWQLGTVELFYARNEGITVQKMAGHTAYVNGIPLDDSHTIATTHTVAESYLPVDVKGLRLEVQAIDGFLLEPEVTVLDENGQPVAVTYDAENDIYIAEIPVTTANTISPEEEALVIDAAETFALYMIEEATQGELLQYFDRESNVFKSIYGMEMWMQGSNNQELKDQTVTEYYRYSDDLFSAHVTLTLSVTRRNGTVKDYYVDTTLFFERQERGWMCIEMTNVDIQEQITEVRITFIHEDNVVHSAFYVSDLSQLTIPVVSAPEGKVFAGWYQQNVDAEGNITWSLIFSPDSNGLVNIPAGNELEPMTLYALFEDAPTEGE